MTYWIRVKGLPLSDDIVTSVPQWETLADGGCGQASFTVHDSLHNAGRALVSGAGIEVMRGMLPVYSGVVEDYDPDTGEVACVGLAAAVARYIALDASSNTTRDTATATAQAAVRGWGVVNRSGTFGTVDGNSVEPQPVATLLDGYADQVGQRWGVSGSSRLYMRADPTVPRWFVAPGAIALGSSTEGAVSHYIVVYDSGSGYAKTIVAHPKAHLMSRREEPLDLTKQGTLTLAQAQTKAGGIHAVTPAGLAWSTGATVPRTQITTIGDTPADLPSVLGGHMVRIFAPPTSSAVMQTMWIDAVIGKTRYAGGEESIYLEPVNKAPRSPAEVIAAA